MNTSKLFLTLFFLFFSSSSLILIHSFDFEAGDHEGWKVPPSNNTLIYNQWASKNRFTVGDTINFRFKKDSVMVVSSEEEYKTCNSSHPFFFSNNGRTVFKLERAGMFYFISGVLGHCEKGQKMMVKVMVHDDHDDDDQSPTRSPSNDTAYDPDYSTAGLLLLHGFCFHVI
ncbi:Cupredoxins domain-containing protein [Dioscorea alata]|uniref:Cupredoxins domain-containing protein n=1 Tax=Dioscorea alata TaxID=55571 RepID=A0ACB7WA64_DIOAL|nr:Cupredoxins domain-containing protein [Dioscorea alata]